MEQIEAGRRKATKDRQKRDSNNLKREASTDDSSHISDFDIERKNKQKSKSRKNFPSHVDDKTNKNNDDNN